MPRCEVATPIAALQGQRRRPLPTRRYVLATTFTLTLIQESCLATLTPTLSASSPSSHPHRPPCNPHPTLLPTLIRAGATYAPLVVRADGKNDLSEDRRRTRARDPTCRLSIVCTYTLSAPPALADPPSHEPQAVRARALYACTSLYQPRPDQRHATPHHIVRISWRSQCFS